MPMYNKLSSKNSSISPRQPYKQQNHKCFICILCFHIIKSPFFIARSCFQNNNALCTVTTSADVQCHSLQVFFSQLTFKTNNIINVFLTSYISFNQATFFIRTQCFQKQQRLRYVILLILFQFELQYSLN